MEPGGDLHPLLNMVPSRDSKPSSLEWKMLDVRSSGSRCCSLSAWSAVVALSAFPGLPSSTPDVLGESTHERGHCPRVTLSAGQNGVFWWVAPLSDPRRLQPLDVGRGRWGPARH